MAVSSVSRFAFVLVLAAPTALFAQMDGLVPGEQSIEVEVGGETMTTWDGTLTVPAVRDDPASGTIDLRYVRFPTTAEDPGSPIVYLAGGPGGSGIDGFRGSRGPFYVSLRAIADVIAFDQRGTGDSGPDDVFCGHESGLPLEEPGSREGYLEVLREETRRCLEIFRERGIDVRGFTTAESADDVDALRRHLGTPRLTLLGSSYGTHLSLAVARRHPDAVERMVLAGVEGPDHTIKMPGNVERNVADLGAVVRRDPLFADRLPDLVGTIDSLHRALRSEPREIELVGRSVVVGPWDLREYVSSFIGSRGNLAGLPASIHRLVLDDWSELGGWVARRRGLGGTHAMSRAMDCASYATDARLERIRAEAPDAVAGATIDFPMPEICDVAGLTRLGDDFRAPLDSDVPTLMISGTLDGRTPLSNAREVAEGWPAARHLIIENAGHGADLYLGTPEIEDAIRAFLRGEPAPDRLAMEPLELDPPYERSLSTEILERIRRDGYEATAAWYRRAREEHAGGLVYDFDESVLNRLGYELLAAEELDLAIGVFRLNVLGHPEAFNPWDSLGEGYMNAGETEKAIEAYEKSLELNSGNDNGRRMLERLRGD